MDYLFQYESYPPKFIIGTAYGLSENSIAFNKEKFRKLFFVNNMNERHANKLFNEKLKILDTKCANLIHEFYAYLSG